MDSDGTTVAIDDSGGGIAQVYAYFIVDQVPAQVLGKEKDDLYCNFGHLPST